jgi:hypothetical protein
MFLGLKEVSGAAIICLDLDPDSSVDKQKFLEKP